ncbi:MAG: hypothetical protein Q8S22_04550 [Eubacteriales bacterium]|nr:hypothetical protein [Eubacteriales bacterium]
MKPSLAVDLLWREIPAGFCGGTPFVKAARLIRPIGSTSNFPLDRVIIQKHQEEQA